jgi:tetratricopeptide (TPR) repeat protein
MIQLKMGNIVEARQLFQAILRETPIPENRANVLLGLGLLENSQNNYQEALRTWRQAAQLGPWDSSARSAYEAYQLAKKLGQSAEVLFFKNLLTQNFPRSPWIEHLE